MKKTLVIIIALLMVVAMAAGCNNNTPAGGSTSTPPATSTPSTGSNTPAAPTSDEGPIRIAGVMAITGVLAGDGELNSRGIELAVNQANANGGVLGRQIEYIVEDGGSTPDTGMNAVNKVLSGDYDVMMGPHFSAQVLAITDIMNEKQMLNIFGGTNPTIMGLLTSPYSVRCRVPDAINARGCAVFMEEIGCKKIGLFTVSDDFGQGAKNVMSEYFDSVGIEYVTEIFNSEDRDFTTQLLNMKNAGIDSMVLWGLGDTPVIIARQMYELGMSELKVMSSGVVTTPDLRARMEPEWYADWYSNSQWNPQSSSDASIQFNKDYEEAYGQKPNFLAAAWYSTTKWYLDCVEKAGTTDKDAVLAVMKETKDFPALNGNYTYRDRDLCNSVIIVQTPIDGTINDVKFVEG